MDVYQVLRRPIITEKSTDLIAHNQYVFEVAMDANKVMIRDAVERVFKVNVVAVNVLRMPRKMRRVGRHRGMTSPWKKAIVTLRPGERIEAFGGA